MEQNKLKKELILLKQKLKDAGLSKTNFIDASFEKMTYKEFTRIDNLFSGKVTSKEFNNKLKSYINEKNK